MNQYRCSADAQGKGKGRWAEVGEGSVNKRGIRKGREVNRSGGTRTNNTMQLETKLVEGWYALSYRAGDLVLSSRKWDQPPLVPPVEEGGPQVHMGKVGGRGWEVGVGGKEEQEGREEGGRGQGNSGHRQKKKAGRETRHTASGGVHPRSREWGTGGTVA